MQAREWPSGQKLIDLRAVGILFPSYTEGDEVRRKGK
jgi:hypothetical protein